jgi:dTDP-L-rhamnose 4-epimerase
VHKVLVTGGAGFIGSHLVDALVHQGARVRVLDSLEPQVHGSAREVPAYFNPGAELVRGDVRDRDLLWSCLDGVDAVFHLAAAVGVGQSMYEIERYVSVNTLGTSVLLDLLSNRLHSVRKLVVASSMSIYGEGSYRCPNCGTVEPGERSEEQMRRKVWELFCPTCDIALAPVPTREDKTLHSNSIYAISKRDQEEMTLCIGKAYGLPTAALRFFNVFGPRQALSNPYTGAAAIFSSRAMNGNPPIIYEDGFQTRDFVHVSDIVQSLLLVMERDEANYRAFNVGSGRPLAILDMARMICEQVGPPGLQPEVVGSFRKGDIRHCFADIGHLSALGYVPRVSFEDGLGELTDWVRQQTAEDRMEQAMLELKQRGLVS